MGRKLYFDCDGQLFPACRLQDLNNIISGGRTALYMALCTPAAVADAKSRKFLALPALADGDGAVVPDASVTGGVQATDKGSVAG